MEISSDSGSGETRKPWATGGKECRGRCQCPGNYGRSSDLSQGLGARGASSGLPRTAVPREMRISSGRGEQIKQSTRRCSSWSKAKNKNKKIRTWRRSRINDACHALTSLKVCHLMSQLEGSAPLGQSISRAYRVCPLLADTSHSSTELTLAFHVSWPVS